MGKSQDDIVMPLESRILQISTIVSFRNMRLPQPNRVTRARIGFQGSCSRHAINFEKSLDQGVYFRSARNTRNSTSRASNNWTNQDDSHPAEWRGGKLAVRNKEVDDFLSHHEYRRTLDEGKVMRVIRKMHELRAILFFLTSLLVDYPQVVVLSTHAVIHLQLFFPNKILQKWSNELRHSWGTLCRMKSYNLFPKP